MADRYCTCGKLEAEHKTQEKVSLGLKVVAGTEDPNNKCEGFVLDHKRWFEDMRPHSAAMR